MKANAQKVLFLMAPGRRHLIIELDGSYSRKELAVMLAAFRRRLLSEEALPENNGKSGKVNQIVGPGFVIEMLGGTVR